MKKESFKILLFAIAAAMIGIVIAKVDTSPNWDDAGITAMAVLFTCAILGFINPKQALLWAVLIGTPTALLNIIIAKNYGSFAVLLFSFAGSYIGLLVRRFIHIST